MRYGVIYRIIFKNGKCYIGQTINIKQRVSKHKYDAFYKKSKLYNTALYRAIRKYGIENIEFEILYNNVPKYQLDDMEKLEIKNYNSYCGGYNSNLGGNGNVGYKHSDKELKKMSERMKGKNNPRFGKKVSNETRQKSSKSLKDRYKNKEARDVLSRAHADVSGTNNPMYGKNHSKKSKDKISKSKKGKEVNAKLWYVTFPDGKTDTIKNLARFCIDNNLLQSCMSEVASGKQTHHRGYKCRKIKD